ncbi:protein of unknown function [Taphrina deformans PYCC 5710]|uniref:3-phytase n=1 Tax=Taphrina deformans (strain PYCC 5710 / ATCC 11124 / CBS 356.35 / IMI 108563 / JCM 9778 / NBRC 8474) TaxID=1097556 RepID=R4XFC4_TAPDE|nr:protein of unknown function [Taphrina deformans PYCC 5710]|eukprot:CCG84574.1 protein of unknown function [Taphrina deformans PYCC 5710]
MASLLPSDIHRYSDAELSELYPADLKLLLVQSIFRHGERAPVRVRLENAGIPRHFDLCNHVSLFQAAVKLVNDAGNTTWGRLPYTRLIEETDDTGKARLASPGSAKGTCLLGELTDKGRASTVHLGERLRELYVTRLGFAREINVSKELYLRSSPMPRALESLQQVYSGLFPVDTLNRLTEPIHIRQRNFTEENLFPNEGMCPKLRQLSVEYAKKAADEWNPILAGHVTDVLGRYVDAPVRVDGHPRLSGLMDTINATRGNDLELPAELLDAEMLDTMHKAVVSEWFGGYLADNTYRRLGAGRILGDFKDQIVAVTKGSPLKFALYGAHDTTLGAILASVGGFDHEWPRFTSHIALETFERKSSSFLGLFEARQHLVRMRYNDRIINIPSCRNPQMCTLKEFVDLVDKLTPDDWQEECKIN